MIPIALKPVATGRYHAHTHGRDITVTREGPLWAARLTTGHQPIIARSPSVATLAHALARVTPRDIRQALTRDLERNGALRTPQQEHTP